MILRLFLSPLLVVAFLVPFSSPVFASSKVCRLPEPKLAYSVDRIVVSLDLDLTACRWWKGDSVEISGNLRQGLAGTPIGQGLSAFKGCLMFGSSRGKPARVNRCKLSLVLDHDQLEQATYSGAFTFPWRGKSTTQEFEYDCTSLVVSASCG